MNFTSKFPFKLKKVCALCQAPADKSCGACHKVDYCSVDHQKSHWKVHKKDCPPVQIVTSPTLGPHFVATRDLPPGTLLLTELPVLVNPFEIIKDDKIFCISCRSILPGDPWPCSQCSTPFFCNESCSMNSIHSEFECGILSKFSAEERAKLYIPPNLTYLRAFHSKINDPGTWTKVLDLRGSKKYKPEDAGANDEWFIQKILPLLGEQGVGFDEDMAKLRGITQQRGIVLYSSRITRKGGHGETHLLYLKGSNFTQNCFPNCTPIISKGPEFQLQVRSSVGVRKGQILSIDYVRISYVIGAMARQHVLFNLKGVFCICQRCTDPTGTELGTMLSAVKCEEPNCEDGYLLPVNVRNMAENAPWRCNSAECNGEGSTWEDVDYMIQQLNNIMKSFLANEPLGDGEQIKEVLDSLQKKLHPNHWIFFSFKSETIKKVHSEIKKEMANLSISQIQMYITMVEDLLKMTEVTAPGFSLVRGRLWNNLLILFLSKWYAAKLGAVDKELFADEEFKRKTIGAIYELRAIAKFYPETWPEKYFKIFDEFLPELQLQLHYDSMNQSLESL